jgi:hypothetical protein
VFPKLFPSLRFLSCIQCVWFLPLHTEPTQGFPTKVLNQARALPNTMSIPHGKEPRDIPKPSPGNPYNSSWNKYH